ncbi:MAG: efflux RND transporter periplasmic adaptor subunit [Candidatus Latescibacteria bacterium]|nr:efflux RND transporter periplasmic adaptor subunit [Candidatus Latescibacterota bacterium]NIO29240.1 efflux RND transporter periplasmic adaptor subunit [Candidatus Latescibacterota bacterium]NIO56864.1 efflux RND transporter periplasmic adaptor subunit [Candidatus Latescibacterota bacterium]
MKMDDSGHANDIVISPTQLQTLGVRVDTLRYRKLEKVIRTVGRVDYDERRLTTVSTKVSGWIEKLHVDYTGKFVKKQEPLYEIYSPEVVSAEEEYVLALRGQARAGAELPARWQQDVKTLLESAKRRLEFWDVPSEHIQDLEKTQRITKTMMIHSPADGFVLKRNILEGSFVKPGYELFTIADISRVWVYADIYEYELPLIETGQTAEFSSSYFPGETFIGKVTYIYPYLEEKTRTVKVRFEFANPGWKLKPGMFANVRLNVPVAEKGLALPEEAVLDTGERQLVFIRKSEGVFEPREVKLGLKAEGYYQVLEGVAEGEVVAVSANFLIDSESRLGSAMMKMKM